MSDRDKSVLRIEQQVSTLRQLTRHLRAEVAAAQREHGDSDFTRLGSHATQMLRAAEAQASDLISKAATEAERIKEEGRRVAADLRAAAQTEADDIRVETLSNLRDMREQLDTEISQAREATQRDCQASIEAAKTQAKGLIDEASHNSPAVSAIMTARQLSEQAARMPRDAEARSESDELLRVPRN